VAICARHADVPLEIATHVLHAGNAESDVHGELILRIPQVDVHVHRPGIRNFPLPSTIATPLGTVVDAAGPRLRMRSPSTIRVRCGRAVPAGDVNNRDILNRNCSECRKARGDAGRERSQAQAPPFGSANSDRGCGGPSPKWQRQPEAAHSVIVTACTPRAMTSAN